MSAFKNIIPVLSSNTGDSFVKVSSSSVFNATYEAWKAFDTTFGLYQYWGSQTGQIANSWLKVEFAEPQNIGSYQIQSNPNTNESPKRWILQGSNDDFLTIVNLSFVENQTEWVNNEIREYQISRPDKFKYYRIFILDNNGGGSASIGRLMMAIAPPKELLLLQSNNKIYSLKSIDTWYETNMTSNTTPSPLVASASSIASSNNVAWKAFNGSNSSTDPYDIWATAINTTNGWLQLDFGLQKSFNAFKITSRAWTNDNNYTTCSPETFTMQGSNDGINFIDISEVFNETSWGINETRVFPIKNTKNYRYYRLNVFTVNGGPYVFVAKLEFSNISLISEIPNSSVNNFVEYGTNRIGELELILFNKNYILQDEVSENEEGLWTTQLDRKPLSISFS